MPTLEVSHIATTADADGLAQHLNSAGRTAPAVVITAPAGRAPFVDADQVAQRVEGLVEVYVLTNSSATWALTHALPAGCQVYGGASRVYPTGRAWLSRPSLAPTQFAYSVADGRRAAERLARDALELAASSDSYLPPPPMSRRQASGVVAALVAGRGMVRLDDGGMATIWPELTPGGVAADRLLTDGMPVHGLLDLESHRLDVTEQVSGPDVLRAYSVGDGVLSRVDRVTPKTVTVALLPGFEVDVSAVEVTGAAENDLRRLFTVGETVTMAVIRNGGDDASAWRMAPIDVDAELLAPAVPVLIGGPPWLAPPIAELPDGLTDTTAGRTNGDTVQPTTADINELVTENDQLRRDLAEMLDLVEAAEAREAELKAGLRRAHTQLMKVRETVSELQAVSGRVAEVLFADPVEQFRHEVYVAWAARTSPDDKAAHPRAKWSLGPNFLPSLEAAAGVDRHKVVHVVVEIITGRVHDSTARQTHQLRTGSGGRDPVVTAADGAPIWRVSLQHKTPQARRLHYVKNHDGSIVLSSVRLHDDFRP